MRVTARGATLDDVVGITAAHASTVRTWRHPVSRRAVAYEELDLYGRWRNGGPWMSVEMCAVHLNHLLRHGHLPLVATAEGEVVGEAEYYVNREPPPFAALHLSVLYVHRAWQGRGMGRKLLAEGVRAARDLGLPALTTNPDEGAVAFYGRAGFVPWRRGEERQLTAKGEPPPGLRPLTEGAPPPSKLALRVGRYQCGPQGWEALFPALVLPGWNDKGRWAWQGHVKGIPTVLGLREQLTDPAQADGYAWLPVDAPLEPAVAALGALAKDQGFAAVDLLLPAERLPRLRRQFRLEHQTRVTLWRLAVEGDDA